MQTLYFNTTGETGEELRTRRSKATSQAQIIYRIFVAQPNRYFTPFKISQLLGDRYPVTSIRRAMSNLTSAGKLEKTRLRKMEKYGAKNYMWRLAK